MGVCGFQQYQMIGLGVETNGGYGIGVHLKKKVGGFFRELLAYLFHFMP